MSRLPCLRIILRYVVISGFNTVFSLLTFPLLYCVLERILHLYLILLFAFFLNVTFSFFTNKYFVFKVRGKGLSRFRDFAFLNIVLLFCNVIFLKIATGFLHPVPAQTIFGMVSAVSSFLWNRNIVFRQSPRKF